MESYYRSMSHNYFTEPYDGIILRKYITELYYGDIVWHIYYMYVHYSRHIKADILRQMYYGRHITANILRLMYYGIYIYRRIYTYIYIYDGRCMMADVLGQVDYGRYITADILWQIHYSRYIAYDRAAISRQMSSARGSRLLHADLLVATHRPNGSPGPFSEKKGRKHRKNASGLPPWRTTRLP